MCIRDSPKGGGIDVVLDSGPKRLSQRNQAAAQYDSGGVEHIQQVGHTHGDIRRKVIKKFEGIGFAVRDCITDMFAPNISD